MLSPNWSNLRPEANVTAWIESTDESLLYLSVLTLGEIRRGIAVLPQSRRRATLEAWLDKDLRARFEDRILGLTGKLLIAGGC